VELSQSKKEQRDYLQNVELARVLEKRAERKKGTRDIETSPPQEASKRPADAPERPSKKRKTEDGELNSSLLSNIF
jgi:ESF2/ABP1 family protein